LCPLGQDLQSPRWVRLTSMPGKPQQGRLYDGLNCPAPRTVAGLPAPLPWLDPSPRPGASHWRSPASHLTSLAELVSSFGSYQAPKNIRGSLPKISQHVARPLRLLILLKAVGPPPRTVLLCARALPARLDTRPQ